MAVVSAAPQYKAPAYVAPEPEYEAPAPAPVYRAAAYTKPSYSKKADYEVYHFTFLNEKKTSD